MARRFVILLGIVVGVAVLWSGGWYLAANWLRGNIEAQAKAAPSLACANLSIAGFPFRFDITCTGAHLTDGDIEIGVDEIRATALVYMPTFVELFAKAPATYSDAFSGASYRLSWDKVQASVRLDGFSLARASLVADGLKLDDTILDVTEMARVKHAEFHVLGASGAKGKNNRNLALYAEIDTAQTPQLDAPVDADVTAMLTEWPADVRSWGAADLLPYWAAGEGILKIDKAEMKTGDLSAQVSGSLAPDAKGLVDGALTLNSHGFGPVMRQYLAAPLAGALLGPEDEKGEAHQTLIVSHSILRAGIVPLLQFPPLF